MNVKKMLFKTRRGLLFLMSLVVGSIYFTYKFLFPTGPIDHYDVPEENVFTFPNLKGPTKKSIVSPREYTSWRKYHTDNVSAMAVLLTDTGARWIGLAHGLTGMGIPFTITTDVKEAIKHKVVMVYPSVSGEVLDKSAMQDIAAIPRNGGTLIATNVYGGGMNELFDFKDATAHAHSVLQLNTGVATKDMESIFSDVIDRRILLGDGKDTENAAAKTGYTHPVNALINYEDGTGCLVFKDYGAGKSYALGIDLGSYFLTNMNGRGYDANRAYVNRYEAGIDIWLRILKQIYVSGNEAPVTVSPVPFNKSLTMLITHDIDFTRSIVNTVKYAELEQSMGVRGTYFIQTKYVKDWNDDIFFNSQNVQYLQKTASLGMEIGSHSVAHSKVFSKFAMGTGTESYPDYKPFVQERLVTYNGTILGELRISKFLLESSVPGYEVHSFRPGHLQYPFALPQALQATGFRNTSSVTGGSVQTNLPYQLMYNREYDAELDIVEIPVAVEDEAGLPMLSRLDSAVYFAGQLAKYGGVLNVLIHTDILGQKYEFEQKLLATLKDKAWVSTVGDFGEWWRARSRVTVLVTNDKNSHTITVKNGYGQPVKGITLQVPPAWKLVAGNNNVVKEGNAVIIDQLNDQVIISFK